MSGGEAQRIRLATQIGSRLTGVLYVLDEPSIGLHQRDNDRLINTLKAMRDLGNTLIVVEHDEDTMMAADYLIDIGPGAGDHGGFVTAAGKPEELMQDANSLTGQYLSGKKFIPVPSTRKEPDGRMLHIHKASENNLKNVDVDIPLGLFVAVTGVSGSGKSTLINEILYKTIAHEMNRAKEKPGAHKGITGLDQIDKVIDIDQSPIGRTPRSNPQRIPVSSMTFGTSLLRRTKRNSVVTKKDVSVSTSRVDAVKRVVATGSSRLRCTSYRTSMFRVKSVTGNATTAKHSK